jgi:LuxR family maltose regulon positive regulatory protein
MALTYWHMGNIPQAATTSAEAARLAEQAGNWHAWVIMLSLLARLQAAQGHLRKAAQTYLEAVQERPGVPSWAGSGLAQSGLAALFYEWNDLDRAADYARAGLEYSRLTGHGEIQMSCHRLVARICQARGDATGAQEALNQAMQAAREHKLSGLMFDRIAAEQVQIALLQGDIPRAVHWLEQVQGEYGASFHYPTLPLERAMLAMAQDDKVKANAILAERFQTAVKFGIRYGQIEIRILQAMAASDEEQAISFLAEALHLAEPEGCVRVFIDQGKALAPLLNSAACRGITPNYINQLLLAYTEHETSLPGPFHLRPDAKLVGLLDQLSDRELEVLRLIASGCSNKEIADELVIAVGTVKRHTANIFQKLDAANRTQAVARARELGLL